jgi:ABC-type polysaccharide/polyol phosphate export permease
VSFDLEFMQPTDIPPPPFWISLVPLVLITIPFLIMICFLARRKGRNLALYFLLGLIPGVNMLSALWLASQTDVSIRAELADLKRRLDAQL